MFNQIFPPDFDPINAGFFSMAEEDMYDRTLDVYDKLMMIYGDTLPFADIITKELENHHLVYDILPPRAKELLDEFDIQEGNIDSCIL